MTPKPKLNFREREILSHWKANRPIMCRELAKAGDLEAAVKRAWEEYTSQLHDLTVNRKLPYNQAAELLRELIYLPSEKDQPHLGERPVLPDPTTRTTTSSPTPTASAKATSAPKPKRT